MKSIPAKRFGYSLSMAILAALLLSTLGTAAKQTSVSTGTPASADPVVAAAGDIACDPASRTFNRGKGNSKSCRQKYTADLLMNANLTAVLALGDTQYFCGGYRAFLESYNLSWGRVKSITYPILGNHEYLTYSGTGCNSANEGAAGYFEYFGSAAGEPGKGYYSFDIGAWHLIALNSNCGDVGGCGTLSPQAQWLEADLAANTNLCTLVYWHIPLFSSGGRASTNMQTIWESLYAHDVELVLTGHDHIYERFAPQTASGELEPVHGIREFVVGTGGSNHSPLEKVAANSLVRNDDTYGVLMLTLHANNYHWEFVPEKGKKFRDVGTAMCHGNPAAAIP
jgi:hypothetical protein